MTISSVCRDYFNPFENKSIKSPTNKATINTLAALKIASYFTVVIPLGFGIAYGISLLGRGSKKPPHPQEDVKITQAATDALPKLLPHSPSQTQKPQESTAVADPDLPHQTQKPEAESFNEVLYGMDKAIKEGGPNAIYALFSYGIAYEKGKYGLEQNYEKAFNHYKSAADQGDATSQCAVARFCDKGLGVPKDEALAMQYYAEAAKKGNPEAFFALGEHYEEGKGVLQDRKQAIECYLKAADKYDSNAIDKLRTMEGKDSVLLIRLGDIYQKVAIRVSLLDKDNAVSRNENLKNAIQCYTDALEGNTPEPFAKLLTLLREYPDLPHQEVAKIQFTLGQCYEKGLNGAEEDIGEAMDYYEKAVENDSPEALRRFNEMIAKDPQNGAAFYQLGRCYENGYACAKDMARAKAYYESAVATENGSQLARAKLTTWPK